MTMMTTSENNADEDQEAGTIKQTFERMSANEDDAEDARGSATLEDDNGDVSTTTSRSTQ